MNTVNTLKYALEPMTGKLTTSVLIAGIMLLVAGTYFLSDTLRRRRKLRRNTKVAATVVKSVAQGAGLGSVSLSFMWKGQPHYSSPIYVYSLPVGKIIPVWVEPTSGFLICVDMWTENYKWRYLLSSGLLLFGLIGLGLYMIAKV